MAEVDPYAIVREHLRRFFAGHDCEEHVWPFGPTRRELPRLRVLEFSPGPMSRLWVYATIGMWEAHLDPCLEFLLTAPSKDRRHVELLSMSAWYHAHYVLGSGHTYPIGEPWLPSSVCEFFLVSLPYPFGPDLEVCNLGGQHLHYLWLLPITGRERRFKVREGLEALEQRFDACGLEYWDPDRASVV